MHKNFNRNLFSKNNTALYLFIKLANANGNFIFNLNQLIIEYLKFSSKVD